MAIALIYGIWLNYIYYFSFHKRNFKSFKN